jgi:hypothetical protein
VPPSSASSLVMADTAMTAQGTTVIGKLMVAVVSGLLSVILTVRLLVVLQ